MPPPSSPEAMAEAGAEPPERPIRKRQAEHQPESSKKLRLAVDKPSEPSTSEPGAAAPILSEELARAETESVTYGPGKLQLKEDTLRIRGLYADRGFIKGQYITKVEGSRKKVNSKQLREIKADPNLNRHLLMISHSEVIQGLSEPEEGKGAGSFANDGGYSELSPCNCQFTLITAPGRSEVYLEAIKDIKTGNEIRAFYGKEHWELIKKTDPDLYKLVFEQQILKVDQALEITKGHNRHQSLNDILGFFQYNPVPYLHEWRNKRSLKVWSPGLIRYYMFKLSGEVLFLTPSTLKCLNPTSTEYLQATTAYIKSIPEWTNYNCPYPVPDTGLFKKRNKWTRAHAYYLKWREDRDDSIFTSQLVNTVLTILYPENDDFNYFLMLHFRQHFPQLAIKRAEDTEKQVDQGAAVKQKTMRLDFTASGTYEKAKKVVQHLKDTKIPLPDFLRGSLHSDWTLQSLVATLEEFGITVIQQLDIQLTHIDYEQLREAAKHGRKEQYLQKFSTMCDSKDYKFKKFVDQFGIEGNFPEPRPGMLQASWDKRHFTASCLAIYLEANPGGIPKEALDHVTIPMMVDALTLMNIQKHTTTTVQVLGKLANSYSRESYMAKKMRAKEIVPEEGKTWSSDYVRSLKKNQGESAAPAP